MELLTKVFTLIKDFITSYIKAIKKLIDSMENLDKEPTTGE